MIEIKLYSILFRSVPFRSVPFRSVPFRSVPFRSVPFRSVPFLSFPFRSVPFRSVPFHFIPFHSIPFYSILFYSILVRHYQQSEKNEEVHDLTYVRVTTWRHMKRTYRYDNGDQPSYGSRDDLDKYWSDMIWQRTAQDGLTWSRHAEAFAQLRHTTYGCPMMMAMVMVMVMVMMKDKIRRDVMNASENGMNKSKTFYTERRVNISTHH